MCQIAEDDRFDGRIVTLNGRRLVNFGSCSYLGLETDARLKTAACEAVLRYGVQFSSSRAYVAAPLYRELERLLSEMAGGARVVLAATTSLAHLGVLPVLVGERDAVLYDTQVHASAQAVLPELRLRGVTCEPVRHNRLERLEQRVQALARTHERVFYVCDGVYSMHGDRVDVEGLYAVLERNPALFAYVDDAHGVGWSGARGAGTVLGFRSLHPRMVVVLGLAKSFATAGGAVVLPNAELAETVLTCGRTLIFSGPVQPAQLGAGIASAKIHLSDELPLLQERLLARIDTFDQAAYREGIAGGQPRALTDPFRARRRRAQHDRARRHAARAWALRQRRLLPGRAAPPRRHAHRAQRPPAADGHLVARGRYRPLHAAEPC